MSTHPSTISRRKFLQTGALLSSGLLISFTIPQVGRLARIAGGAPAEPFVPNAYLHIAPDNVMTVMLSHVEMGQGIWTTLPMLLADELDADLKSIRVMHGSIDKAFNHTVHGIMITGGSTTPWSDYDRYRKPGVAARIMITLFAANRPGRPYKNGKTRRGSG